MADARSWYLLYLSRAHIFRKEYDQAIAKSGEGLRRAESNPTRAGFQLNIAFAPVEAGRIEEARKRVAMAIKMCGNCRLNHVNYHKRANPCRNPAHLKRLLDALRKAGLPE